MDVREALYTTRAMRRLAPDPIPADVIARIVDAGLHAPSPGATQAWRFVVVTDRATMRRLADIWRSTRDALLEQIPSLYPSTKQAASSNALAEHFDDVPLLILGYGPEASAATTVVPALWSMCLAARAEGIGSTFTTLLTRAEARVNEILGAPPDTGLRLIGALPMGFPLGRWGVAARQGVGDVVYEERWGSPPSWPPPS